ncbi:hypothetical protein SAMN05216188_11813 [Lentzea xinjiangensis]|uniref:T6SS immunity protein Tdi1 C-terminal domain-containing protein n=1 Tax=Lentzea xinjiangensis TaxID=402600 RepID=A0A1H9TBM8_9PSEU|nr:hypothetical protein [Lentzea xinjiangensis]SER94526.1 hypothetical protein SAMN05216188_11813 [Lentzea xinjiangensis]
MNLHRHDAASAAAALTMVREMFPELDDVTFAAVDWLGRQYLETDGVLAVFDPGSAEVRPHYHPTVDEALAAAPDELLRTDLLAEWRARHPEPLAAGWCAGYRQPLFLGGEDSADNLEAVDLAAYWSTRGRTWLRVKDLPPDRRIGGVIPG